MQNFLARCLAVGIVAGGFAATGDVGRLQRELVRVVNSRTVPTDPSRDGSPNASDPATQRAGGPPPTFAAPDVAPNVAAAAPGTAAHAPAPSDLAPSAPAARPTADGDAPPPPAAGDPGERETSPRPDGPHADRVAHDPAAPVPTATPRVASPPLNGPDRVDLASLRVGDRVVCWVGAAATVGSPRLDRCVVFDLVEPAAGEALLHRAAGVTPDLEPIAARVPERVRLSGGRRPTVVRGGMIDVVPAGLAHGGPASARPESIGPVHAIAVVGRE